MLGLFRILEFRAFRILVCRARAMGFEILGWY